MTDSKLNTPEMNKVYIPQGYMPIEDMELGLGNMSAFELQPPK